MTRAAERDSDANQRTELGGKLNWCQLRGDPAGCSGSGGE